MIKKITLFIFISILCSVSYYSISNGNGPAEEMTNAPSEGNCTSCHNSGSLITSGSNWNNISLTSNFTGNGYIPDSVYDITISYSQSGIGRWGFEATILNESNKMAGSLSGSGRVQKISSSTLSREYVEHTASGTSSKSTNATEWTFKWKAPSKNVGTVTVYLCLNAADGDNSSSGDEIYAKTFTIKPSSLLPVASASSPDSVACAGATVALKGNSTNSASSWSWTVQGATFVTGSSTSQNPVVKFSSANTYLAILTSKNSKGSSLPDTQKIVIKSSPTVSIAGNSSYTICKGDSVKLVATSNSNYTYKWSPGGATTSTIMAGDTGTYFVTATDKTTSCSTLSGVVKISHHPYYTVKLTRDITNDSFCQSKNVTFTANGTGTLDTILYYTVSSGLFLRTANNPRGITIVQSSKIYTKGKDSKGCLTPNSDTLNFVVSPNPKVSISGTSATICKGDSVKLTANGSGGGGVYTYKWLPWGYKTQTIQAKDSGFYGVRVTDQNKCTDSSNLVKISHFPYYSVSITRDVTNDSICLGTTVKITATANPTITFDSLFYYSPSGLFQKTKANPLTLNLSSNIKLFVRGKDSKKCLTDNSNTFNFVVKNPLSSTTLSCLNKTTNGFDISWSAITGATGYRISLDSGKIWKIPSSGNSGLSHSVNGFPASTNIQVWVKALDNFPCNESPVSKIVCGSLPCSPLSYDIIFPKDACKDDLIMFKIRNLKSNFYSLTLDGGTPFKDTIIIKTAIATHTYKFELTDSANLSCPTVKSDAAIKVWVLNSVTLSGSPSVICDGSAVFFTVSPSGVQDYNFFLNGTSTQKSLAPDWFISKPKNTDSVWVIVTNGACIKKSSTLKLKVQPLPNAGFTYLFAGRIASFTPLQKGYKSYKWSFGDISPDTVAPEVKHNYTGTTSKKVTVKLIAIDSFGCISNSSTEITVPSASISKSFKDLGIKMYPQPASNNVMIEFPNDIVNAEISISDKIGRTIYTTQAKNSSVEINTLSLVSGIYFITIKNGGNSFYEKLIIDN